MSCTGVSALRPGKDPLSAVFESHPFIRSALSRKSFSPQREVGRRFPPFLPSCSSALSILSVWPYLPLGKSRRTPVGSQDAAPSAGEGGPGTAPLCPPAAPWRLCSHTRVCSLFPSPGRPLPRLRLASLSTPTLLGAVLGRLRPVP